MNDATKQSIEAFKQEVETYLADPDFTLPQKFDKLRGQLVELTETLEGVQATREYIKEKVGIMGSDLQRIELERLTDD